MMAWGLSTEGCRIMGRRTPGCHCCFKKTVFCLFLNVQADMTGNIAKQADNTFVWSDVLAMYCKTRLVVVLQRLQNICGWGVFNSFGVNAYLWEGARLLQVLRGPHQTSYAAQGTSP